MAWLVTKSTVSLSDSQQTIPAAIMPWAGRQLAAPKMVKQHIALACGTHHCSHPGLAKLCLAHIHISVWQEPLPSCKHRWSGLRYNLSCRWNPVKSFRKYLLSLWQLRPSRSEGRNVFPSSPKLFKSGPYLMHLHRQAESSPDSSLEKNLMNSKDHLKEGSFLFLKRKLRGRLNAICFCVPPRNCYFYGF